MADFNMFGLGEGVGLFIIVLMCILAAPLPRSLVEMLLNLKPNVVVLVAAVLVALLLLL